MASKVEIERYLAEKVRPFVSKATFQSFLVVEREQDIPKSALPHLLPGEGSPAPSYFHSLTGNSYIIAERVKGGEKILGGILRHDLTHKGLSILVQEAAERPMEEVVRASRKVERALDNLYLAHKAGVDALGSPGGACHGVFDHMSPVNRRRRLSEEYFVRNRETCGRDKWFDTLVHAIREFFRSLGIKLGMNDAEWRLLENMVDQALRREFKAQDVAIEARRAVALGTDKIENSSPLMG